MRYRLQLVLFCCLSIVPATFHTSSAQETDEIDIIFRSTDTDSENTHLYALDIDTDTLEPSVVADFDGDRTLLDFDVSPDGSWVALLTLHDDSIWFSHRNVLSEPEISVDLSCTDTYVEVHILGDNQTAGVSSCSDFTLIDTTTDPPDTRSQYDGISVRDWVGNNHYLVISRGGTAHICFQALRPSSDTDCQEITSDNPLFGHLFSLGFTQDGERVGYLGLLSPDEDSEIHIPIGIAKADDDYVAVEDRIDDVWGAPQNIGRAGLVWHPDGVRFLYQFQAPLSDDSIYGIVLYDTETDESELLISGLEIKANAAVWSLDGEQLALLLPTEDEQQIGGKLWIYDMTTAEFYDLGIEMEELQWLN